MYVFLNHQKNSWNCRNTTTKCYGILG